MFIEDYDIQLIIPIHIYQYKINFMFSISIHYNTINSSLFIHLHGILVHIKFLVTLESNKKNIYIYTYFNCIYNKLQTRTQ